MDCFQLAQVVSEDLLRTRCWTTSGMSATLSLFRSNKTSQDADRVMLMIQHGCMVGDASGSWAYSPGLAPIKDLSLKHHYSREQALMTIDRYLGPRVITFSFPGGWGAGCGTSAAPPTNYSSMHGKICRCPAPKFHHPSGTVVW